MTELLVIREHLKKVYTSHSGLIDSLVRAVLVAVSMLAVDSYIGYFKGITHILIIVLFAVIAAVLPASISAVLLCAYTAVDLSGASIEVAAVFGFTVLLFVLLYFVFKPGNSFVMTLSIMLGTLQFLGPIPLIIGLMLSPVAVFPMIFGVITSKIIIFVSDNYVILSSKTSSLAAINKMMTVIEGVFLNTATLATIVTLSFVAILVYVIRRLAVKYSWVISVCTGAFMYLLVSLMFDYALNLKSNILVLVINTVLALFTGFLLMFLFHMVDYTREENVQFEDDDYYYYVKAIPKIVVSVPDVKVTRIKESSVKEVSKKASVVFASDEEDYDEEDFDEAEDNNLANTLGGPLRLTSAEEENKEDQDVEEEE